MRAAVYVRISKDRTGEELGVTRQREDAEALVKQRGWTLTKVYKDNDISAAGKKRRPDFDALLVAANSGQLDAVVAWSLDRLTRNRRDELRLIEACQAQNVTIALVRGSDIDMSSPAGRLTADVLASVARHEIEQKGDRVRRSREQAAQAGKRAGGRKPLGYLADGVTLHEGEAPALRKAYADVLAGVSLRQVAREWNAAGMLSGYARQSGERRGEPSQWVASTVRNTLLNPRNAGLRSYKGEIVAQAEWPAIVPEETWRAACSLLGSPDRRVGGRGRIDRRLLSSLATCGVAGCGLYVHAGRDRTYPLYRCGSERHVNRAAEPIERYVGDVVIERLSRPDARELLVARDGPNADELRESATMLRQRLDSLAAEWAVGELTDSQLRTANEVARRRLTAIEAEMADAGRLDTLGPLIRAETVAEAWGALDTARQRAAVDTLMSVRIFPAGRGTQKFRPESVGIERKV